MLCWFTDFFQEKKVADKKMRTTPVKELIAVHQERIGYKNMELAQKLGYPSPNVISMLKAGTMRLPISKITQVAEVLHIDPLYLAMCVDVESNYELTPLLDTISKRTTITFNEETLIRKLREVSDGLDMNLNDHPQELATILAAFGSMVSKERDKYAEEVSHIKTRKRPALTNEERRLAAEKEKTGDASEYESSQEPAAT